MCICRHVAWAGCFRLPPFFSTSDATGALLPPLTCPAKGRHSWLHLGEGPGGTLAGLDTGGTAVGASQARLFAAQWGSRQVVSYGYLIAKKQSPARI